MASITIRKLRSEDVTDIFRWTSEEKWSLTKRHLDIFANCYGEDIFVAEVAGKPVGCVAGIRNKDNTGVFGLFVVTKGYRGKGIGRDLMKKAHEHLALSEGRNVGLSGRFNVAPTYAKNGYVNSVWDVSIYTGQIDLSKVIDLHCNEVKVIKVTEDNLDKVLQYDGKVQSVDRKEYFRAFLNNGDAVMCAAVKNSSEGEEVVGFALATEAYFFKSHLSPVYANTPEVAGMLVRYLAENHSYVREGFYMESIEPNEENVKAMLSALGATVTPAYKLRRMYTGSDIKADYGKIYSLPNTDMHLF